MMSGPAVAHTGPMTYGGGMWRGTFPILLRNPGSVGIMGEGVPMPRLLRMPAQAAARRI